MTRLKINLRLDADAVLKARELGINLSTVSNNELKRIVADSEKVLRKKVKRMPSNKKDKVKPKIRVLDEDECFDDTPNIPIQEPEEIHEKKYIPDLSIFEPPEHELDTVPNGFFMEPEEEEEFVESPDVIEPEVEDIVIIEAPIEPEEIKEEEPNGCIDEPDEVETFVPDMPESEFEIPEETVNTYLPSYDDSFYEDSSKKEFLEPERVNLRKKVYEWLLYAQNNEYSYEIDEKSNRKSVKTATASNLYVDLMPGIGKSTKITEGIFDALLFVPDLKFYYMVVNHRVGYEATERFKKYNVDVEHIFGKDGLDENGLNVCLKPKGQRYFYNGKTACSDCPHKCSILLDSRDKCYYSVQRLNIEFKSVIVGTFEHLAEFGKGRIIIVDDSFDNKMMAEKKIGKNLYLYMLKHGIKYEPAECEIQGLRCQIFTNVSKFVDSFDPKDEKTYFFREYLKNIKHLRALSYKGISKAVLFGEKANYMPTHYKKILFACATTPIELICKITMTKMENWKRYEPVGKYEIKNKVVQIRGNYTISKSTSNIDLVADIIRMFPEGEVSLLSKKGLKEKGTNFEEILIEKVPSLKDCTDHYESRGSNKLNRHWDLAVMFCQYEYPEIVKYKWTQIGYGEFLEAMKKSAAGQLLHRVRLILHPDTRIMLLVRNDFAIGDFFKASVEDLKRYLYFHDYKYHKKTIKSEIDEIFDVKERKDASILEKYTNRELLKYFEVNRIEIATIFKKLVNFFW